MVGDQNGVSKGQIGIRGLWEGDFAGANPSILIGLSGVLLVVSGYESSESELHLSPQLYQCRVPFPLPFLLCRIRG